MNTVKIKHFSMKKYLFFIAFYTFSIAQLTAQNNTKPDYQNWMVDLSKAQSSYNGIKIDKVELNNKNTVIHMSFRNLAFYTNHIEACNTFHIRSNGKRVANFIRAENIPTRNVKKIGFSCADTATAMRVRPGQFVRFRLYFTRIPQYLNNIDIIEFNGQYDCEFDVWNLNISRKEPLPPTISPPAVATAKPKTQVKKPINTPKKATQSPAITAKSPKKTPSYPTVSDAPTVVATTPSSPTPSVEKREVKVIKEYTVKRKTLQLEVWDNDQEDGDVVSVKLNDHWILKNVKVTKTKKKLEIPLSEGANTLVFHAENLGAAPPNTAALSFWDGQTSQTIILNSDMNKSEGIKLILGN